MSDEEEMSEEEEQQEVSVKATDQPKESDSKVEFIKRKEIKASELDEQLAVYIEEWRKQKRKEEEELKVLKEKQVKRKGLRALQDKQMEEKKKKEEERVRKEVEAKKKKEQEDKMKRIEEVEKRRQLILQAEKASFGIKRQEIEGIRREKAMLAAMMPTAIDAKEETRLSLMKTKEQLAEEKEIAVNIRVGTLDASGKNSEQLKAMVKSYWDRIVKSETEKYDFEERQKRQEYDLKELKERQKQQLRHKALKLGLEPEALIGKYPPKIRLASKFERRVDTRSYSERKVLFIDGYEKLEAEDKEKMWKEKMTEFGSRAKAKLPKWFGERPGRKAGDPPTPEEEIKEITAALLEDDIIEPPFEEEEPEAPAEEEEEEEEVEEEEEEEEE